MYSASPASLALVAARPQLISDAFGSLDPRTAQYDMPVEDFAAVLAELKPKFIHHPVSKELIKSLLASFGCDARPDLLRRAAHAYFDVRRLSDVRNLLCLSSAS